MIVHPDFFGHWKTRRLIALTGNNQAAPIFVLQLWCYCQQRRANVFPGMTPSDLAVACHCTDIAPEKLQKILLECCFIRIENESDLVVHGWNETNRMLVSAWENGSKGGRKGPQNKPNSATGRLSHGLSGRSTSGQSDRLTSRSTHGLTHPNSSSSSFVLKEDLERVNRPVPQHDADPGTDLELRNLPVGFEEKKSEKSTATLKLLKPTGSLHPRPETEELSEPIYTTENSPPLSPEQKAANVKKFGAMLGTLAKKLRSEINSPHGDVADSGQS